MGKKKRFFVVFSSVVLTFFCLSNLWAGIPGDFDDEHLAAVSLGTRGIQFQPKVISSAMVLSVSQPDGTVFEQTFEGSSVPYFELPADAMDGSYTYELCSIPELNQEPRKEITEIKSRFGRQTTGSREEMRMSRENVQTGHFRVQGGRVVIGGSVESTDLSDDSFTIQDVVHLDDVIIDGSLAVGFDAVNGESFGFDTIRLKENNLRIHFDDTSSSASFPRNDWRIIVNDSSNGGASYFAIEDSTAGRQLFKIEAGARANSLYVDDGGRVGFGTATPVVRLHTKEGNTPTLRLEQDGSQGWTPQTWDLAGNETNFFIRDVTSGSRLPFRIQPGAPTSTLTLRADGKVGMGTWSPESSLEIEDTGENVLLVLDRTDGAKSGFSASGNKCAFGTLTNHPLWMVINGAFSAIFHTDGSLQMMNGAWCTAAGVWQDASSRELKQDIRSLTKEEAIKALEGLDPVKFKYKADKEEESLGFIAEDVPELVATKDRKTMSPMDVVAVLTKVVQDQQKVISELRERIEELESNPRIDKDK